VLLSSDGERRRRVARLAYLLGFPLGFHLAAQFSTVKVPAATGAIWGTSFALDKTIQIHVGHMAHSAHDVMENLSYTMLVTAAAGTMLYGYYVDDPAARSAYRPRSRRPGNRLQ